MDLTLREGYWIKFCMKLIAATSHDNYYSQLTNIMPAQICEVLFMRLVQHYQFNVKDKP
jgi:hypothetical protein